MHRFWAVLPIMALTACGTEVAPREEGVGFGDYESYLEAKAREREAKQRVIAGGMVVSPESTLNADVEFETPVREPIEVPEVEQQAPVVDTLAQEQEPVAPAETGSVENPDNPEISDEQNFDAVSARETIESDRERLQKQRDQFKVIEPTALPKRRGSGGPNIVAFALSTTHSVGDARYGRGPFKNAAVTARNCAKYLSSDQAQEAFLAAGGPKKDSKRLDPDGDGFACAWDPAPFRVTK